MITKIANESDLNLAFKDSENLFDGAPLSLSKEIAAHFHFDEHRLLVGIVQEEIRLAATVFSERIGRSETTQKREIFRGNQPLYGIAYYIERAIDAALIKDYADAARKIGVTRARLTQFMDLWGSR